MDPVLAGDHQAAVEFRGGEGVDGEIDGGAIVVIGELHRAQVGRESELRREFAVLAEQGQAVGVLHALGVVGERLGDHADGLDLEARGLILLACGVQEFDGLADLRLADARRRCG